MPISFEAEADLNLLKQQIPNEARLRPRASIARKHPAGPAQIAVQLGEDFCRLDFVELVNNARPDGVTDYQAAYAATYVVSEKPQTGFLLLTGSDESARIYLNEKEIHRQLSLTRAWVGDLDEVTGVELKAGLNVLVFKVANGNGNGDRGGSACFLDGNDQPVKGDKVTLDPDVVK